MNNFQNNGDSNKQSLLKAQSDWANKDTRFSNTANK